MKHLNSKFFLALLPLVPFIPTNSSANEYPWLFTAETDPVYQTTSALIESQVVAKRHIYEIQFRCIKRHSDDTQLKLYVTAHNKNFRPAEFNFYFYRNNETKRFIDSTMRIGDMEPGAGRWVLDGYSNRASIDFGGWSDGSFFARTGSDGAIYSRYGIKEVAQMLSEAATTTQQLVIAGFFPDDPLVTTLGRPNPAKPWEEFQTNCPVLAERNSSPDISASQESQTSTKQTAGDDQSGNLLDGQPANDVDENGRQILLEGKLYEFDELKRAYAKLVEQGIQNSNDPETFKSLNRKSEAWREDYCNDDKRCVAQWFKTRASLLEREDSSLDASFDCAKATSLPEMLICIEPKLAASDRGLSTLYQQAKRKTDNSDEFKRQTREEWRWREASCKTKNCLTAWYSLRREQLNAILDEDTDWKADGGLQSLSSDRSQIAWIDTEYVENDNPEFTYFVQSLYSARLSSNSAPDLLFRSSPDAGISGEEYSSIRALIFAPDNETLYVEARPGLANYTEVLAVNSTSGELEHVQTGFLLGVLATGAYKGALLLEKKEYREGGGTSFPVEVVERSGDTLLTIPGTQDSSEDGTSRTRAWVSSKGWQAIWR